MSADKALLAFALFFALFALIMTKYAEMKTRKDLESITRQAVEQGAFVPEATGDQVYWLPGSDLCIDYMAWNNGRNVVWVDCPEGLNDAAD